MTQVIDEIQNQIWQWQDTDVAGQRLQDSILLAQAAYDNASVPAGCIDITDDTVCPVRDAMGCEAKCEKKVWHETLTELQGITASEFAASRIAALQEKLSLLQDEENFIREEV